MAPTGNPRKASKGGLEGEPVRARHPESGGTGALGGGPGVLGPGQDSLRSRD